MSRIRLFAGFGFAFLSGLGAVFAFGLMTWLSEARPAPAEIRSLSDNLFVASQIAPRDIDALAARGIGTIVDLRPDGEAPGQPASEAIGVRARALGMRFAYVPVPHGALPDAAVDRLAKVLAESSGPVLLYCRSGSRAARTWALAEAARPDGLQVAEIDARVGAVGQSIDDLTDRVRLRAALRAASQ